MAASVQLILARDVPNLGRVGELVSVKAGYARNFLVPKGLAMPASPDKVALFEHQKKVVAHRRRQLKDASEGRAQEMAKLQVTLTAKVGEQDKLFGSITSREIAKALAAEGHVVDHRDIKMPDGPLKSTGLHTLDLRLEADVTAQIKIVVAAEIEPVEEAEDEGDEDPGEELVSSGEPDINAEEAAIEAAEDQATGEEVPAE